MTERKISIIVPVYNTEKYVEQCLESLLRQTYRDIEIIIVNDGSKGDIRHITEEYKRRDKRVKYYEHPNNLGLFAARCTGMKYATGEYFAFVDSDDWVCEDYFRTLIEKARKEEADIVTADYLEIHEDGVYVPHNMLSQGNIRLEGKRIIDYLLRVQGLDYGWWVVWNKLYARHIWEESFPVLSEVTEHLVMCEDVVFSTNFFSNAKRLSVTHGNYYYYRKDNESATVKATLSAIKKNLHDIKIAFCYAGAGLKRNGLVEQYEANLQNWKNSIARDWQTRVETSQELSEEEKDEARKILSELTINEDTNPINLDRGFCSSSFDLLNYSDKLAEIKRMITDPQSRIISFDVFDTLLMRPFWEPTDLFELMDHKLNQLIQTTDWFDFKKLRCEAEKVAREVQRNENPDWDDITFNEIYDQIVQMCPDLAKCKEKIQQIEFQMELRFNQRRETAFDLYQLAKHYGKKVICISDMYLSSEQIHMILEENGYTEIDKIYVSCEIGKAKANKGALFQKVMALENVVKGGDILHIGDNLASDVINAKNVGLRVARLPRTIDAMREWDEETNSGEFFKNYCMANDGYRDTQQAFSMLGFRCMIATAANRVFDNPFIPWKKGSDLNNDAYTIGHLCLGPAMFGMIDWLIKNVEEGGYKDLHFMARDGYLPMKIYEELNRIYQLNVKTHYTYLTRKAITPLMIQSIADYYNLVNNMLFKNATPDLILKLLLPLIPEKKYEQRQEICKNHDITTEKPFANLGEFCRFGNVFFDCFYDKEKAEEYRVEMGKYLNPMFQGKTATFDVGYSGRIESMLARNYGYDITAHYIHTNTNMPYYREELSGIQIKTLFPFKPFVTGVLREIMISELGPSCIGYKKNGTVFEPQMGTFSVNIQTEFVVSMLQESAMDFVKNMTKIFGEDIKLLKYRYFDACMPLEHYMLRAKKADMEMWGGFEFEDDMGMGDHISVADWWKQTVALHEWAPRKSVNTFNSEEYLNSLSPLRKTLVLLGTDLGAVKDLTKKGLQRNKPAYYLVSGIYLIARLPYRMVRYVRNGLRIIQEERKNGSARN